MMRHKLPFLPAALATLAALQAPGPAAAAADTVAVDPAARLQTIEGWGASLCWWANRVGRWPARETAPIIGLITSPGRLNMNIFRYNIGGGDDPSHRGGHMVRGKGARAEMEGFRDSPDAPYRWNADAAQRRILLAIRDRRPDAVFEAFANSPPFWMTVSGCSAGHRDPDKDNLRPECMEAFCGYLVDICKQYRDRHGIVFRTLEPFNEPQTDYWRCMGGQEGCHFDLGTQIRLIRILDGKLRASGLPTVISAADDTCLAHFRRTLDAYGREKDIMGKIGRFNTHTYYGTDEERIAIRKRVRELGKPLWQSETGPGGGTGRGLEGHLNLTQKLFDDMRLLQPAAWLDWQLLEPRDSSWCLICYDFDKRTWHPNKNFYVRMQVTRFFKQGYVMLETPHRQVLAALSPGGDEAVAAVLNAGREGKDFEIRIPGFDAETAEAYRTSRTEECARIAGASPSRYHAPKQSITTFVLKKRPGGGKEMRRPISGQWAGEDGMAEPGGNTVRRLPQISPTFHVLRF